MEAPLTTPIKNPLDLSEIRHHIAQFLTPHDLSICIRVCKEWYTDYIGHLWHSIDLMSLNLRFKDSFQDMVPLLPKYGPYIKDLFTPRYDSDILSTCTALEATRLLEKLVVQMGVDEATNAAIYQLLKQNIHHLKKLICYWRWDVDCPHGQLQDTMRNFPSEILFAGRWIEFLDLWRMNLKRDDFSDMLQGMPFLRELRVMEVFFLEGVPLTKDYFRHPGITTFCGNVKQLWGKDCSAPEQEPLMIHMPNLTYWWNSQQGSPPLGIMTIKDGFEKYFPGLKKVDFDWYESMAVVDMLETCFLRGLEAVEVLYNQDFEKSIECLVKPKYRNVLKELTVRNGDINLEEDADLEEREFFVVKIEDRLITEMVVMLFPNLTVIHIPAHEIEKSQVEVFTEWGCKKLEVLIIRFEGLNTRTLIRETIELVKQTRRFGRETLERQVEAMAINDLSLSPSVPAVSELVARHLLQFKSLRRVWLGTLNYNI